MSPADIETLEECIDGGFFAVESIAALSAGGYTLPDNTREYWISTGPRRVARVWATRGPAGRWRVDEAEFFRLEPCGAAATPEHRAALAGLIPD